jgi:hypothetical protein
MRGTETSGLVAEVWNATDLLLEGATIPGVLAHELGPLAAHRLRRLGEGVPRPLALEGRAASLSMLTAIPLIGRVRANSEGVLMLIKGPEIAELYPGAARRFSDVDLLSNRADEVHRALIDNGFVEVKDPEFEITPEHHHLQPLHWPTLGLSVELHKHPYRLVGAPNPPIADIFEARVPSALGLEGVFGPDPLHHALILTAHAWSHEPLHTLRDLVDIAAVAATVDEYELQRTARAWGIGRIWETTSRVIEAIFHGGRRPAPLRSWARHLPQVRERSILEEHLARLLHTYWAEPPHRASAKAAQTLRASLSPLPGETWREKLSRTRRALQNPAAPVASDHVRLRELPDQQPPSDAELG